MIRLILALLLLVPISRFSLTELHTLQSQNSHDAENEVLYLPNGRALKALSFGYQNMLSNLLWFKTVSYFGKHFKSDKDYRWLDHMCNLVTDLNPRAEHVYEFCSTMLSWETGSVDGALNILTKAINQTPDYWRYYYLRGFTYLYFKEDAKQAESDFITSSKQPNAPAFVARLAASQLKLSNPADAIYFLKDMIKNSEDPIQRKALEDKLKEVIREANEERKKEEKGGDKK